jgi:predicted nucleic acid-binding Zn ribbon protein
MHCPNCGKQISPDQKFCRFCGRSLEAISKVASEHASVADSDNSMSKVTNRMPARRMNRALFWGIIAVVLGVTLLSNAQGYALVNWLGILVFLVGIGTSIYGAFSPNNVKALPSGQSYQPKDLNQSEAELYLPPKDFSKPVPAVTERTTELLEIDNTKLSR